MARLGEYGSVHVCDGRYGDDEMVGSPLRQCAEQFEAAEEHPTRRNVADTSRPRIHCTRLEGQICIFVRGPTAVDHEPQFKDKFTFYRWNVDDPFEERFRQYAVNNPFGALPLSITNGTTPSDELPSTQDLTSCLIFLSTVRVCSL